MITSIHTLIYSDDANATRAFLRDVLKVPGADDIQLYQPTHKLAYELQDIAATRWLDSTRSTACSEEEKQAGADGLALRSKSLGGVVGGVEEK